MAQGTVYKRRPVILVIFATPPPPLSDHVRFFVKQNCEKNGRPNFMKPPLPPLPKSCPEMSRFWWPPPSPLSSGRLLWTAPNTFPKRITFSSNQTKNTFQIICSCSQSCLWIFTWLLIRTIWMLPTYVYDDTSPAV